MRNTNELIHDFLRDNVKEDWICVDMTCGHGYDTLELAKYSKFVYSFDIQQEAIDSAKEKTKDFNNIQYILDDHQNVNSYIDFFVNCVIFNLGYLPKGNKNIKTNSQSTLIALSKINRWIRLSGLLIITCYRGHPGGINEYNTVLEWLNHQLNYEITTLDYGNKTSPIAFICRKKSFDSR